MVPYIREIFSKQHTRNGKLTEFDSRARVYADHYLHCNVCGWENLCDIGKRLLLWRDAVTERPEENPDGLTGRYYINLEWVEYRAGTRVE